MCCVCVCVFGLLSQRVCVCVCCVPGTVYLSAGENICLVNNNRAFSSFCYSADLWGSAVCAAVEGRGGLKHKVCASVLVSFYLSLYSLPVCCLLHLPS